MLVSLDFLKEVTQLYEKIIVKSLEIKNAIASKINLPIEFQITEKVLNIEYKEDNIIIIMDLIEPTLTIALEKEDEKMRVIFQVYETSSEVSFEGKEISINDLKKIVEILKKVNEKFK